MNTVSGVAKRAAEQRKKEVKAWERIRQKRLREISRDDRARNDAALDVEGDRYLNQRKGTRWVGEDSLTGIAKESRH